MTRFAFGLLIAALPIALVAQQQATAPQTQAPSSTTFPKGTYVVHMQDGSVLEVTFADGTYNALSDGQPVAAGKYTTKANQIVVSDDSQDCGNSGQGTYTWAFDGKTLTFKGNQDACDTRLGIMTGYAFVKK